ncbi:MAG TPA: hypothetical protein VM165_23790 [Planctomycetaceae bacterium]|nr:hypothetical protein [Planctomycetaceae bacterium]
MSNHTLRFAILTAFGWALSAVAVSAAGWVDEQQHGIFVFRSDFPLRDAAEVVADLGELQKDIEATLDIRCQSKPIEIYLFRNRWSYSSHVRKHVPDGDGRQALFVAGNDVGRVYAYRRAELDIDLRHETTHALLHNALPYVPLWLDEGLAEYFENPAALRVDRNAHRRDLARNVLFGWKPNLAELEAKRKLEQMKGAEYREAWGWVHFMLHGPPEARAALDEFLTTIPTGREPTPLSISLRRRIPDVDRRIVEHLR